MQEPANNPDTAARGAEGLDWLELLEGIEQSRWITSGLIFLGSIVFARVFDWLLTRGLLKLAKRSKYHVDDEIVVRLHAPLMRTVVLLGLMWALRVLEFDEASWLHPLLQTLAVLVWVPFAFVTTKLLLTAASANREHFLAIEPRTFPLFDNLAKVLLFAGFTYVVFLVIWKLDPSGFLASAGILGIAIGFAAQDTLANLFAGVFIIADAPYRVGDFITLDSGERGEVLHIGLRSTRMLTRDDIEITIPNSIMGKAKITNEAGGPSTAHRIRLEVSVAYGSDVDLVRALLIESASKDPRVLGKPEPRVRFRAFGNSGLEFELLCWIPQPVLRGLTLDELHTAVYKRFQAEGVEIPYPKRDVYLHRVGEHGD